MTTTTAAVLAAVAAVERLTAVLDVTPVHVLDRLAELSVDSPIGDLARVMKAPATVPRPDGRYTRGSTRQALICTELARLARRPEGDVVVMEAQDSRDPLWVAVGEALLAVGATEGRASMTILDGGVDDG